MISTITLIIGVVLVLASFLNFSRSSEHELSKDFAHSPSFIIGTVVVILSIIIKFLGIF